MALWLSCTSKAELFLLFLWQYMCSYTIVVIFFRRDLWWEYIIYPQFHHIKQTFRNSSLMLLMMIDKHRLFPPDWYFTYGRSDRQVSFFVSSWKMSFCCNHRFIVWCMFLYQHRPKRAGWWFFLLSIPVEQIYTVVQFIIFCDVACPLLWVSACVHIESVHFVS